MFQIAIAFYMQNKLVSSKFKQRNLNFIYINDHKIDSEVYLEILYCSSGLTKQFLESNPINTNVSLKMIKPNGELYGEKIYGGKFKDYIFVKLIKFISLKDLMNPTNSLYNKQTDSVSIEAQIKIID